MKMVLVMRGKGNGNADSVSVKIFESGSGWEEHQAAAKFCDENTVRASDGNKYWTKCEIVDDGESVETFSE